MTPSPKKYPSHQNSVQQNSPSYYARMRRQRHQRSPHHQQHTSLRNPHGGRPRINAMASDDGVQLVKRCLGCEHFSSDHETCSSCGAELRKDARLFRNPLHVQSVFSSFIDAVQNAGPDFKPMSLSVITIEPPTSVRKEQEDGDGEEEDQGTHAEGPPTVVGVTPIATRSQPHEIPESSNFKMMPDTNSSKKLQSEDLDSVITIISSDSESEDSVSVISIDEESELELEETFVEGDNDNENSSDIEVDLSVSEDDNDDHEDEQGDSDQGNQDEYDFDDDGIEEKAKGDESDTKNIGEGPYLVRKCNRCRTFTSADLKKCEFCQRGLRRVKAIDFYSLDRRKQKDHHWFARRMKRLGVAMHRKLLKSESVKLNILNGKRARQAKATTKPKRLAASVAKSTQRTVVEIPAGAQSTEIKITTGRKNRRKRASPKKAKTSKKKKKASMGNSKYKTDQIAPPKHYWFDSYKTSIQVNNYYSSPDPGPS